MDKLFGLITSVESAIRYVLTGIVATAIFLAAKAVPMPFIDWGVAHTGAAFAVIVAAGFLLFILYRLVFWVVGDYIAWYCGVSAPSVTCSVHDSYPQALAHFLIWRYSDEMKAPVGGYLTFRWSICHFCVVSALFLALALSMREGESIVDQYSGIFWVLMLLVLGFGLFQYWFLFIVDRELYRFLKK